VATLRKLWRNYVFQRLVKAVIVIFAVTTLTFFLVRLMPGNPLEVYINALLSQGVPLADAQAQAAALYHVDLNKPVMLQYVEYLSGVVRGNFGTSITAVGTPVSKLVLQFLPWTLFVVMVSLIISFSVGLLLGMVMAYKRETWFDHLLSAFASVMSSVPNYLVGMLILVYLGVRWKIVDTAAIRGSHSPDIHPGFTLTFFLDALYHATLPILTYVLTTLGHWMLVMKSSTLSTLGEDYVTVARARGLTDARITLAYVGRNAVLPLFTQLALSIGSAVGGSILIETIFTYQGIGSQLSLAMVGRDYPVMQGVFIIITASVVTANLLADMLYSRLDPRIRVQGR
jgi:peptide/nickel transport system permease protein